MDWNRLTGKYIPIQNQNGSTAEWVKVDDFYAIIKQRLIEETTVCELPKGEMIETEQKPKKTKLKECKMSVKDYECWHKDCPATEKKQCTLPWHGDEWEVD